MKIEGYDVLPCPFCEEKENLDKSIGSVYVWIECHKCFAEGPPDLGLSGAIELWNTRVVEEK
jgi:hypothetical protein